MKTKYLLILIIPLLFSCAKKKNIGSNSIKAYETHSLNEKFLFPQVSDFLKDNNFIYCIIEKDTNSIAIFDNKGNHKLSFGKKGKGPKEFIMPQFVKNSNNKIWIYDIVLKKLLSIKINPNNQFIENIKLNPNIDLFDNPTWLNDSIMLALSLNKKEILYINKKGTVIKKVDRIIPKYKKKYPDNILAQVFQGYITSNPNNETIAVLNLYTERIEIYKNGGLKKKSFWVNEEKKPIFKVIDHKKNQVLSLNPHDTFSSYIDVSSNSNIIIGLVENKRLKKSIGKGQIIHVFNWNGELIKKLKLNKKIKYISINKSNIITALGFDKNNKLKLLKYEFSL